MPKEALNELREQAMQLVMTRPAETTPEAEWVVAELEKNKHVLVAIIDYLLMQET